MIKSAFDGYVVIFVHKGVLRGHWSIPFYPGFQGAKSAPKKAKIEKNQTILNLKTFFGGSIVVAEKCGRENTTTIKAGTACENGSGMGTYKYGRSIGVQLVVA